MKIKKNVVLILPAYNEEKSITPLFNKLVKIARNPLYNLQILVINDGSNDLTAELVNRYVRTFPFIHLNSHSKNMGLGSALKTGFNLVLSGLFPADIVITMDCDNTHDPSFIEDLVNKIEQGYNIVIASRFILGGKEIGLGFFRKILSRGASLFMQSFIPLRGVSDYSSGYRAYDTAILRAGWEKYGEKLISSSGFDCMAELLVKLGSLQARITEIPLILHYERKSGQSKMKIIKTILGYFRLLKLRVLR